MTHEQRLAQVKWLATMMDDRFAVPGTRIKFGWDAIIGVFPGFGDALTSVISLIIVHHAWQAGASPALCSPACSAMSPPISPFGSVPVFGDIFDVAFKANRKNARLLEQHLNRRTNKAKYRFGN